MRFIRTLTRTHAGYLILVGILSWAIALSVVLAIPELRSGDRAWWPWTCVAGLTLGLLGAGYLIRGRGNANSAR
ncbi:MAG: DUF2530 domain-containing protein [Actinomycetota bacterium]